MGSLTKEDQRKFLRLQRQTELTILNLADVICCTCATAGDARLLERGKKKKMSTLNISIKMMHKSMHTHI